MNKLIEKKLREGIEKNIISYIKLQEIINNNHLSDNETNEVYKYLLFNGCDIEFDEIEESDEIYSLYFNDITKHKVMNREEEMKAFKNLKNNKAERDRIINSNLRLVVSIAKNYTKDINDLYDLIQEGNIGLIKAVDNFNVDLGCKFSTYATLWIKQKIARKVQRSNIIKIPYNLYEKYGKIKHAMNDLQIQKGNSSVSIDEVAEYLNVSSDKIQEVLKSFHTIVSFDETKSPSRSLPINDESYFSKPSKGEVLIEDKRQTEEIDSVITKEYVRRILKDTFADSNDPYLMKRKEVLDMYIGFENNNPIELNKIGNKLSISRERTRQLKEEALNLIRETINNQDGLELDVLTKRRK